MKVLNPIQKISDEAKRNILIEQLHDMGVDYFNGEKISELDYFSLRQVLSITEIKRGE